MIVVYAFNNLSRAGVEQMLYLGEWVSQRKRQFRV